MIDTRTGPYAIFGLRFVLGLLFLAHAGLKIFVFTPAGTAQFFGSLGLPPALAYVAILWELAAAVALILGVWPRLAALAAVPVLLGAIISVHWHAGFFSPIRTAAGSTRRSGLSASWLSRRPATALWRSSRRRFRAPPTKTAAISATQPDPISLQARRWRPLSSAWKAGASAAGAFTRRASPRERL